MNYRPEIDGLRALAVSLVIGFHYLPFVFTHGFLGVDIFFVISGFVISGSMWHLRKSSAKDFLVGFWSRRIKRLMPALIVCIILMSIFLLLLTSRPSKEMFATGSMSLVGLSNFYLYFKASDYFALDAQLNPFTHTWSLGVEEQFYLLFPFLAFGLGIVAAKSRNNLAIPLIVLFAIFIVSALAFSISGWGQDIISFYLSPFRFWELLAGVIAFLLFQKNINIPKAIFYVSALAMVLGIFLPILNPGLRIFLVVISTAILMASLNVGTNSPIISLLSSRVVNYIGRLSYSLYLYHWPIYVIAALTIGHTPAALVICLLLTFFFSVFSYHFVEKPFRKEWGGMGNGRVVLTGVLTALPLAGILFFGGHKAGASINNILPNLAGVKPISSWVEVPCHGEHRVVSMKNPLRSCLGSKGNGRGGDIYILGDSHAAQLTFMIKQLTSGTDRETYFINTGEKTDFPYAYWRNLDFSKEKVANHVLSIADPGDIILISFHRGHLNNPKKRDQHISLSKSVEPNERSRLLTLNMKSLISNLAKKEIKLILFADTPLLSYKTTIETCAFQSKIFGKNTCAVTREQDEHTRSRQVNLFRGLASAYPENVFYFDPLNFLYGAEKSFDPITMKGEYRMVDWNHITMKESVALSIPFEKFMQANGL